ncbi:helix-turn-helix domain-containing protein [Actinopolymorpha alba]|uniref:helix-turn-helix domain-containing protein n=1 Tax=Actinopolymorpha alba TaxID=533267 RepID=UPI00036DC2E9|nr:helix-turn-helix domain-containing protein [Actinopolymorpha alba]
MTADDLPDPAADLQVHLTPAPSAELLVAARFDVGAGYVVHRDRGAPSWLLTWTVDGAGRFRQGGIDVRAGPGDLVALGPGIAHSYAAEPGERPWSFWWVHCQARPSWQAWLRPYAVGGRVYHVPGVPTVVHNRIGEAFRRLHADARWPAHGPLPDAVSRDAREAWLVVAAGTPARELALGRVEEVVVLATSTASIDRGEPMGEDGIDPRVRRVEALLTADPAAPHTIRSLAEHVALSPSRLAHLFSAQTGRTPMQALRDARLGRAARLLEATDLPIGSVAASAGFGSAFHFSRIFRARFGVPPGAYRRGRGSARPE